MINYIITIEKGFFENFSLFGISNRADNKSRLWAICEHHLGMKRALNNNINPLKTAIFESRKKGRIKEYPALKRDTQVNTDRQCRSGLLDCIPFLRVLFQF